MSTQSLDSDIYDYGFILNSTALHEAAMSVLVTTTYGRWRGTTTDCCVVSDELWVPLLALPIDFHSLIHPKSPNNE